MKFRKVSIALISFFVGFFVLTAGNINFGGEILFKDGALLKIKRFIGTWDLVFANEGTNIRFWNTPQGSPFPVLVTSIKSIEDLLQQNDRNWGSGSLVNVKLRNGNEKRLYVHDGHEIGVIFVDYIDSFTNDFKKSVKFSIRKIQKIVFGDSIGNMKRNPRTKQIFPAEFNFDPYTGEALKWYIVN